ANGGKTFAAATVSVGIKMKIIKATGCNIDFVARLIRRVIVPPVKSSAVPILLVFLLLPASAFAANSGVNMSHYDLMRPDFVAMANEGIVGVIHEATFPRLERDARYYDRQRAALEAGLLWGAYHFGDVANP